MSIARALSPVSVSVSAAALAFAAAALALAAFSFLAVFFSFNLCLNVVALRGGALKRGRRRQIK